MYVEHEKSMLFSNANARAGVTVGGEVPVILFGRFMRADRSEHACRLKELDTKRAVFLANAEVEPEEHIVAYVDDIGRLEGVVSETRDEGFELRLTMGPAALGRLAKKIEWVQAKARGEGVEKRRYERYKPRDGKSHIILSDGRSYPCEVIDISVSGASVRSDVLPAIGTPVTLGRTRGRVVRHHSEGFAIEFCRLLPEEVLRAKVR